MWIGIGVWHTWYDFLLLEIGKTEGLLSLAVSMDVKDISKSGFKTQNTKKPREMEGEREHGGI